MAHVYGERAPAFTAEELEKLVDGVLPQCTLLYGPPDKQVSTHQKKGIWRAIAKEVRTLGVFHRQSIHCRKRVSRSQAITSATKLADAVVPATPRGSNGAPVRPASVPLTPAKDQPIPPPAKVKKGPACRTAKEHDPPSKASSKTQAASAKVPAASAKVKKGQKSQGKALQALEAPGEVLVVTIRTDSPATCTATSTATSTATCPTAATTTVSSSIPSGQPSEAAGDGLVPPSTTTNTCTTASTASIPAAGTAANNATCTATCPTAATTTVSSSIPSGQPSEAAGDGLEPPTTTESTPTSTTSNLQPQSPQDGVCPCLRGVSCNLFPANLVPQTPRGWNVNCHTPSAASPGTKAPPEPVQKCIHSPNPWQDEAHWAQCPLQNKWRNSSTHPILGRMKHTGHNAPSRTSGEATTLEKLWPCTPQDLAVGTPPTRETVALHSPGQSSGQSTHYRDCALGLPRTKQ
ncbi:hypothetical protein NDU88_005646 [Pleurodeles waltl]|uniref:Myb/SANT-like DNA-binding domain-containing protein n=1 Tax=Pleurodeles waltl TaxID=8319 RepID=A0AAV7VNY2_PLEWA|nr:hypothetical protein NDU88_005646 [Pleurodeles waltl]